MYIHGYLQQTNILKTICPQYVSCTSNHSRHCLTNIPFSLARRICPIVENENVKEKRLKELEKNIARTKIPQVINRG